MRQLILYSNCSCGIICSFECSAVVKESVKYSWFFYHVGWEKVERCITAITSSTHCPHLFIIVFIQFRLSTCLPKPMLFRWIGLLVFFLLKKCWSLLGVRHPIPSVILFANYKQTEEFGKWWETLMSIYRSLTSDTFIVQVKDSSNCSSMDLSLVHSIVVVSCLARVLKIVINCL